MNLNNIVVITNRHICYDSNGGDSEASALLLQIEDLCKCKPEFIILREKDLPVEDYKMLFKAALSICKKAGVKLVLHNFAEIAREEGYRHIHLPLFRLKELVDADKEFTTGFDTIGVSIHSKEDLELAEALGATYVTAGHIFATDCKKGVPPRGIEFLNDICQNASIDVYAIGGISFTNLKDVMNQGAKGGCMMSSMMKKMG